MLDFQLQHFFSNIRRSNLDIMHRNQSILMVAQGRNVDQNIIISVAVEFRASGEARKDVHHKVVRIGTHSTAASWYYSLAGNEDIAIEY